MKNARNWCKTKHVRCRKQDKSSVRDGRRSFAGERLIGPSVFRRIYLDASSTELINAVNLLHSNYVKFK